MEKGTFSRISATGDWSFVIGSEFQVFNNGGSVQAIHGKRIVYVSSLQVGSDIMPTPANQLRAVAARRLSPDGRISFIGQYVQGDAVISGRRNKWHLEGFMCAAGTVATCIIDFQNADNRDWAIDVWKSLSCETQIT